MAEQTLFDCARLVKIYGLIDPRTGLLRYVGKTSGKISDRISCHMKDRCHCHRTYWLRVLKRLGLLPTSLQLDLVDDSEADDAECFWIAFFRSVGALLVNSTDGADGGKFHSPETRKKIGIIHLTKQVATDR